MSNIIIHVSEVNISPESGMGRVEYYWKQEFEKRGYNFVHIGPHEVGTVKHPALFPYKAYRYYKKLKIRPKLFIVHEPASGYFVNKKIPCFVESHGVERRYWQGQLNGSIPPSAGNGIPLKTKLLFPIWRFRGCDKGLKYADKLLLINSDDKNYVETYYKRSDKDIMIFKNGVDEVLDITPCPTGDNFTILFNGTWLARKGIYVLVKAAVLLYDQGLSINYLLIGTGLSEQAVLEDWPDQLRPFIKVVPKFAHHDEQTFFAASSIFVLPSYFEGQSLSLLQAMAAGKCCITTNCCGQKDIIEHAASGLLFEPGDYEELARLIKLCYSNNELITRLGLNARKAVEKRSWSQVSKEVADYIFSEL